jgi:hypothetical protein
MSHIQRPLTFPKHPELLHSINEMIIGIKLHYSLFEDDKIKEAQKGHKKPTFADIAEKLRECYSAINEQREDPRKY